MLSEYFPRAHSRYTSLPVVGTLVEGFHAWLLASGYRRGPRKQQLAALQRLDGVLRRRGRHRWRDVTARDLEAYWRQARRRDPTDAATVRNLQRFATEQTLLPATPPAPISQTEGLTRAYATMLRDLRGLAPATIHPHVVTARALLDHLGYEAHPARLRSTSAGDVEAFVRRTGTRVGRPTLQHTVAQLRSFLRFLGTRGAVRVGLDEQIDTPRVYRQEQLPRSLPWATVQAFLRSIDRGTPLGLRDYTMFALIATYGLRAGEVVGLTLDAIDWRRSVVHVPARKTGTPRLLPLTDAVGAILVRYLRHGRPRSPHRQVFLRGRAPAGVLKPTAVTEAFQKWVRRSGLPIPFQGAHCLRHAYAVHLLDRGISLKAIGDLLGHRSAESTAVYLRLATDDLRGVALSVPRGPGTPHDAEGRR
jgi:site-specific recombinase XerD